MGNITGAGRNRPLARKRAALVAIAAAATIGALASVNPVTAAAAPGDSSGGDASQPTGPQVPAGDLGLFNSQAPASQPIPITQSGPIAVVPIGPIQGQAPPDDLKVAASQKPPSGLPPGTVLDPKTLTADNMPPPPPPKVCVAQGPLDPRPRFDGAPHDAMHSLPDIVERNFFNRGIGDDFLGTNGPPAPSC